MKKLLLIIGNGFTIDFLNEIKKQEVVDVQNLFRLGDTVKFPETGKSGYLSYQHCPSLWLLGARPSNNYQECMSLIEEIITCSNMVFDYIEAMKSELKKGKTTDEKQTFFEKRLKLIEPDNQSAYIRAYSELISYLKFLFIQYNEAITDSELNEFLMSNKWGWIPYLKSISTADKYDKITIITYNYDIWLERILKLLDINYDIAGFTTDCKVEIVKPHGSISFVPESPKTLYSINYNIDSEEKDIAQLRIKYDNLANYDKGFIIPPAGDSSRAICDSWAKYQREKAVNGAGTLSDDDNVIICGMSYWHVDRKELDELLINLNQNVNITLINPDPPRELNAVLASLFNKYTVYTSSKTLKEDIV